MAKKYSIDQASKTKGGPLPGVAKGQQEKALDEAIFEAKKGKLTGPVKTQFGYYVFEVTKVTPAKQQTLEQSKASIKQILASQNQQKALNEVRRGLPQAVEGRDGLPQGLRHRRLQERAEEEGHDDHGAAPAPSSRRSAGHRRRPRRRPRARRRPSRLRHACQSQPSPPPSPASTS